MNTYEIIKTLANGRKMTVAELERKLDLSNGSVSKWAKSTPNSKYLEKVADYFDVSVDYLLGRSAKQVEFDLDKAIDNAMSFDGKPVTEHDRKMMKQLWKAYMAGKEKE
ncbi:helix-turn-helix domain-containing protein [Limosilactobacillus fermentum]|uniref:helix-turn-helix domain-containing protein n=1 Tax=Limosilactobacillus fermentum TaxID=1613 RepID=UPI003BA0090C